MPARPVAIVGGGFAGVGTAAMVHRAGYRDDVVVFEREERVGGVWHANTYPGAACDVPSHLYTFAPNRWSRRRPRSRPTSRPSRAATRWRSAPAPR